MEAVRAASGAWNAADHPELADGAARWVREIRETLNLAVHRPQPSPNF
jgi:hypothetical protein